ncbi:hypothetical protein [Vibrio europaeus]|uniref:hypothetical protein n=1 Tax=Vibrio europaeus TaxID=300876 RepID=UPI00148D86B7|nr:hypothetical protein [Vibrio europaeus]NOH22548.1 hypothetical protein [Vibrio europaeus]
MEILTSILLGTFSGAAIVAYLAKKLLNHQFDKLKSQVTHGFELQKQQVKSDLDKEVYKHNLKFERYEQDKVDAIKSLHSQIVDLGDGIGDIREFVDIPAHQLCKEKYFNVLSSIFRTFSATFSKIHLAKKSVEKLSIYFDSGLEDELTQALSSIEQYYVKALQRAEELHRKADEIVGELTSDNQPKDLLKFWLELVRNWESLVSPVNANLKSILRAELRKKA